MQTVPLDEDCAIVTGCVPAALIPDEAQFQLLWDLHPEEHSEIVIHGKSVKVPRWDRAYGRDYPFSNQVATAHPIPDLLAGYLDWAKAEIANSLNGLFVNWHDGTLKHYHGRHRDSTSGVIPNSSILTVSLGEDRVFRLRPYPAGQPMRDFVLTNGDYVLISWRTNQRWTHEIPKLTRYKGRRISVTMRSFE